MAEDLLCEGCEEERREREERGNLASTLSLPLQSATNHHPLLCLHPPLNLVLALSLLL